MEAADTAWRTARALDVCCMARPQCRVETIRPARVPGRAAEHLAARHWPHPHGSSDRSPLRYHQLRTMGTAREGPGRAPHPLPASQPKKDTDDRRPGGRRRRRHFPGSPSHGRQSAIRVVRAGTDAAIRAASPCESHRHHAWRVEGNPAIAAGREGAHITAALKVPRRDRHVHSGEGRAPAHISSPPPPPRPREPRHSPTRRLVTPRAHRRRPRHRRRRPFQEHDHGQVTRR